MNTICLNYIPRHLITNEEIVVKYYIIIKNMILEKLKYQLDFIAEEIICFTGFDKTLIETLKNELECDEAYSWLYNRQCNNNNIFKKYKKANTSLKYNYILNK